MFQHSLLAGRKQVEAINMLAMVGAGNPRPGPMQREMFSPSQYTRAPATQMSLPLRSRAAAPIGTQLGLPTTWGQSPTWGRSSAQREMFSPSQYTRAPATQVGLPLRSRAAAPIGTQLGLPTTWGQSPTWGRSSAPSASNISKAAKTLPSNAGAGTIGLRQRFNLWSLRNPRAGFGVMGAAVIGALGVGFGLLKAGVTSNQPVNRIRGLHQ